MALDRPQLAGGFERDWTWRTWVLPQGRRPRTSRMWRRSTSSNGGSHHPQDSQSHSHHPPSHHHHHPYSSSPRPGSSSPRHHRALLLHQHQHQHQQASHAGTAEGPGLRRAKSNHSFTSLGSTGSLSNRPSWYQEDFAEDEDDAGAGPATGVPASTNNPSDANDGSGRRPRSNSLSSHHSYHLGRSPSLGLGYAGGGTGSSGGTTPRTISSNSLSGMLAASARIGGGMAASASAATTRCLSFSARRWAALLTPQTDLWREREFGGLQVSPQDDRQYRLIRLPNQLRAIVVSDPTTEKAAAALSVKVGAAQDPRLTPGLAHFCEHMLFLGTEKYPVENAYKSLVNKHGGHTNASTSMDMTVYQFDLASAEHYEAALDVFSQFFIAPLFTESATDREMNAVNAEDSKNRINDFRRLLQITKAVADSAHPWAKYSTGNINTLRDDLPPNFSVRTALLALHKEHYHAGNMALALVGPAPLDELEALVREKFGPIVVKDTAASAPAAYGVEEEAVLEAAAASAMDRDSSSVGIVFRNPFPPRFMPSPSPSPGSFPSAATAPASGSAHSSPFLLPKPGLLRQGSGGGITAALVAGGPEPAVPIVRVVPLRDKRELRLLWALPSVRQQYRSPPTRLLSHLVGHEGEGSVFSVLHGLGWASGVSAGLATSQDDMCLFEVTVSLTEQGQPLWQDVAGLVLHYIQLIAQAAPEELSAMFDEVRAMASVSYRFQQKTSEYSYASDLARRLQLYEGPHVLSGGHLYDELDLPALETCLQRLTREENMVVFLSLKDNDRPELMNETEPWYGVPYGMELVPAHQVRQWSCAHVDSLHLPRPNPFIPEEFDLIHQGETVPPSATPDPPERCRVTPELELWYKLDKSFKQPRAYIIVDLCTPLAQRDPAAAELLTRYFDHALAEQTYDALVAGLNWSISTTSQGLSLRFSGFSHKIQTLLHKVLESLLALNLHEGLFALAKEKAIDAYRNVKLARPDEHCAIYHALLLIEGRWDWRDKLRRVQGLDIGDLQNFHHELLSTASVKVGCFGNLSRESAIGVAEQVERILKRNPKFSLTRTPSLQPITRVAMLDRGVEYRLRAPVPNDADENSAVTTYFQAGLVGSAECARLKLLAQILREPTFTQLRTREQLGYIVFGGMHLLWNKSMIGGLSFRVLSKTHSPEEILERVEAFLPRFRDETLAALTPEALSKHKAALVTNLLEPPKTLVGECGQHWAEVVNETREWRRARLYADAVEVATLEELLALYDGLVLNKGTRRKLSVMMHGNKHPMPAASKGGEGKDGVVWLKEEDWLAFRAARPLFPCTPDYPSSSL